MLKTLGPSPEAFQDVLKLQFNLVDLFNLGEVQMNNNMFSLFKWKDTRDAFTREQMEAKILTLLKRHFDVLSKRSDLSEDLNWGLYNAAIRKSMASFKENRKRLVLAAVSPSDAIGPGNIGYVRVLMCKDYTMDKEGFHTFQIDPHRSMPPKAMTVTPIKVAATKFMEKKVPQ
jgi:hypothetical protein